MPTITSKVLRSKITEVFTQVADHGDEFVITLGRGKNQIKVKIVPFFSHKKTSKKFTSSVTKLRKSKLKLSSKYDYKESYKEAYHKMLDEKYGI